MITIDEDFEKILTGKVDWGQLIMKVSLSFQVALTTEIYDSILAQYTSGLPANFKEAGYSQTAFTKLAARVGAMNNNAKVICLGTKVALGNILPTNDYLKIALGDEYNSYGYVREFMGVDVMEIPQTITPNTDNFGISDDYVYFFSLSTDKPIKVAIEDSGMTFENMNPSNTADTSMFYSLVKSWDIAVLTTSAFGIMKVT